MKRGFIMSEQENNKEVTNETKKGAIPQELIDRINELAKKNKVL